jgi:outer membrane protein TolC
LLTERQRISTEVLDALSAINTAYGRYQAAEQEVVLAQRLEEGERTRFQLGDSTLFLVNQRERATAEARSKLIEIQAEYEQAVATFRTVTVQY